MLVEDGEDGRVVWYLVASKLVLVETHSKYLKKHLLAYLLACFEIGFRRAQRLKESNLIRHVEKGAFSLFLLVFHRSCCFEEVCG